MTNTLSYCGTRMKTALCTVNGWHIAVTAMSECSASLSEHCGPGQRTIGTSSELPFSTGKEKAVLHWLDL